MFFKSGMLILFLIFLLKTAYSFPQSSLEEMQQQVIVTDIILGNRVSLHIQSQEMKDESSG